MSESRVVVLRAEAAQSNLAFVQVVFLPVVAQYPQIDTLYEFARPRSEAVMFFAPSVPRAEAMADEADDEAADDTDDGFRAATVRSVMPFLRSPFSRLIMDEVEMDRLVVLTWKRSRDLSVTPASVAIKRQIRLPIVKPNGTLTQRNLPAPILVLFGG